LSAVVAAHAPRRAIIFGDLIGNLDVRRGECASAGARVWHDWDIARRPLEFR